MDGWTVTEEAIGQMRQLAEQLDSLSEAVHREFSDLLIKAEENKDGLGPHSAQILQVLDSLQENNERLRVQFAMLSVKLLKAAAIRAAVLEQDGFAGAESGSGGLRGLMERLIKKRKEKEKGPEEKKNSREKAVKVMSQWPLKPAGTDTAGDLKAVNPNFNSEDGKWRNNCQRTVPCYEMRCRGYDVTAKMRPEELDYLAGHPYDVWMNPEIYSCKEDGLEEIKEMMKQWGDGARVQIVVSWSKYDGHTFVAEQKNGGMVFYDPQNGAEAVESYFLSALAGGTTFCRIDTLEPSDWIAECCEGRKK